MKRFFLLALGALACASNVRASDLDQFAAQIRADQAYVAAHPEDTETIRLIHSAQMCAEMHRVEDQVQAWRAEAKASLAAPRLAAAEQRKNSQPDSVITHSDGSWTRFYDKH
jgi:hypothetical protein